MVISSSLSNMTSHMIRDICTQNNRELPAPDNPHKGRKTHYHHHHHHYHHKRHNNHRQNDRHRHHHHHHHRMNDNNDNRGSNPGQLTVVAGQDLPSGVTGSGLKWLPPIGRDLLEQSHDCVEEGQSRDGPWRSRQTKMADPTDSLLYIEVMDGLLQTGNGDGLCQEVMLFRTARDRHEQNVEIFRDRGCPDSFCMRTIKNVRRGQPFLIWYGEELAMEMGVPVLTPANIQGHQHYVCTWCHVTFAQPNVLKSHMLLQCRPSQPRPSPHQNSDGLVPFHALLANISSSRTPFTQHLDTQGSIITSETTPIDDKTRPLVVDVSNKRVDPNNSRYSKGNNPLGISPSKPFIKTEYNHTDNDVSPGISSTPSSSSSSISPESSFVDENDDDHISDNQTAVTTTPDRVRPSRVTHSAFHRPSQTSQGRRRSPEVISQIPDSSSDQKSALNLSVKQDGGYSHTLPAAHGSLHRHAHKFLTHPHPGPMPWATTPTNTQHINMFPSLPYNTLPFYYNTPALPSTSYDNYLALYTHNHHHHRIPNTFNITREGFESHSTPNTTQESPPTNDHAHFTQPLTLPPSDPNPPVHTSGSPIHPYSLALPSDKEPLDLLPQTYISNKSKRGHLCLYCGKLYSRKYGLKIHMRTHNGYKPLKCKICSRPFGDPSNLNKHVRLHAQGETPYRCDFCGKVLVRRRDLERHVRSRHPMGESVPIDTSSPPSSPISIEEMDT